MATSTRYEALKRGALLQKISLASGLVLFTFATTHFLNHALGLLNLEAMHTFQQWRTLVTRSLPGTVLLAAALLFHMGFGLWKLAGRSTFRLPAWELLQIGLGLFIPFLLLPHVVNTRIATTYFGVHDSYLYELARLWPDNALIQSSLLVIVWLHGCIGLHHWLRLSPAYRALSPLLLFLAIAVPIAALGGFMVSGRIVASSIEDQAVFAQVKQLTAWPNAQAGAALADYRTAVRFGFAAVLLAVAGLIAWRQYRRHAVRKIAVRFTGGPLVEVAPGPRRCSRSPA